MAAYLFETFQREENMGKILKSLVAETALTAASASMGNAEGVELEFAAAYALCGKRIR